MKSGEIIARETLRALGEVNKILRTRAVLMEQSGGVKSTTTKVEVLEYQNSPMIEGFLEAETTRGTALCWSIDITWTADSFRIDASLDRNSGPHSETLHQLPSKILHSVEELPSALIEMTQQLLALEPSI